MLDGDGTKVVNYVETPEYREASIRTAQNMKDGYTRKGEKLESENHFMEFVTLKPGKDKEVSASKKIQLHTDRHTGNALYEKRLRTWCEYGGVENLPESRSCYAVHGII